MKLADRLLLRSGYDLKGNKTGKQVEVLNNRQKRKKNSKPYIKKRKSAEKSPAETRIAKFLYENRIRFISEHWFRTCYNGRGQLLYFDFYLPDFKAVIEFDGLHHFKAIYGQKQFIRTKENDRIKNVFCWGRKIPLLRISCFDSKDIETIICKWFDLKF